jgi:hypothetical protein
MPVMGYASEPLRLAIGLIGMIENRVLAFSARFAAVAFLLLSASLAAAADKVSKAQERAAGEFLAAAASGDPQAVAYAIHPTDLDALRTRILTKLREEAKNNDNTIRGRLFGPAMPLADLERLTSVGFYTTLARRLQLGGRPYREVDGIAALPDRDGAVLVVVRGKPPKERGTVSIVHVVALKPYGKDWKAVVPAQIEAQIEDLEEGRRSAPPPPPGAGRYMSPNFRRVTSKKAREALISTCRNSSSNREMLLATVRIVKTLVPRFEYEGQRAVYDLSGQGLPYNRFVLEQVDKRWYIAE